jgi:ribosome-associated protein
MSASCRRAPTQGASTSWRLATVLAHAKITLHRVSRNSRNDHGIKTVRRQNLEGLALANMLVDTLIDKKGSNILLLDIREHAIFSDYFILCNGDNDRQIRALTDAVIEAARVKADIRARSAEGEAENGWVLVDLGSIIIHLFSRDRRAYYNLEELWSDAHVVLRMP